MLFLLACQQRDLVNSEGTERQPGQRTTDGLRGGSALVKIVRSALDRSNDVLMYSTAANSFPARSLAPGRCERVRWCLAASIDALIPRRKP